MLTVHVAKYKATAFNKHTNYMVINSDVLTFKQPGWYLHFRPLGMEKYRFKEIAL